MSNVDTETREKGLPDPFGLIETAGELTLVMQVLVSALILDTLLVSFKRENVLSFCWGSVEWSADIGWILVAGLAYGLILSVSLPLIEAAMVWIFRCYPLRDLLETFEEKDAKRRPFDCVRDYELKSKADAEQSDYLLNMYREATVHFRNRTREIDRVGTGAFRVLTMLGLNIFVSTGERSSVVMSARGLVATQAFDLGTTCVFIALLFMCICSWRRDPFKTAWIYFPPLYDDLTRRQEPRYKSKVAN
jgi:hypothetical protein